MRGEKKLDLYWFECTACQNKFSLQLTLNFVIIPEHTVLETAPGRPNLTEIMFSTACLHVSCLCLIKEEYHGFLKDFSLPPLLLPPLHPFPNHFYSVILAFSFVKANCIRLRGTKLQGGNHNTKHSHIY